MRDKIRAITRENLFVDGEFPLHRNSINFIDLQYLSENTQRMASDIILSFIKRKAWLKAFVKDEVYIFVDEVKHYISGRGAVIPELLAEGRKYGLSVIWATQCLNDISDRRILGSMMQVCCLEYFHPADAEIDVIARKINASHPGDVARRLRNLEKGSCLVVGKFIVEGRQIRTPLIINIPLCEDASDSRDCSNRGSVIDIDNN